MEFPATKKIILLIDLAGFAKTFQQHSDEKMAGVLQAYYVECDRVLTQHGGTIVKFIGDGCLAVFPTDQAKNAVDALVELQGKIRALAETAQVHIQLGANLHAGSIIQADFGSGSSRKMDIVGRAVNQTFMLGRGAGIRISEPVYRSLPSAARSPWQKHKPPAIYQLELTNEGAYEGMGKDAATNVQRW